MWTEQTFSTDRLDVPALVAGDGPPLVALHGFPDHPATFTPMAERLIEAGWQVVAPFLRGYHPDAMPDQAYYDVGTLVADAKALCDAVSPDNPLPLVGHDWGGFITYGMAAAFPEKLSAGVVMAVPPAEAAAGIFSDPVQLRRSFYIWLFQLPGYADMAMADTSLVEFLWRTWSPGLEDPPHLDAVREVFADPDRSTAAMGYYQAMISGQHHDPDLAELREKATGNPQLPLLVIGGKDDDALGSDILAGSAAVLPEGSRVEVLDDCGHFLNLERPAEIARLVLDWLQERAT